MDPYLDIAGFRLRTPMPPEDVDGLEDDHPGYIAYRIAITTSKLHAQLAKRYAIPLGSPPPEIVLGWIVADVTPYAYRKRGWNPSDAQSAQIEQDRTDAWTEVKEAADAQDGLYELPLRNDDTTSDVSKGGPYSYSEPGPYEWMDRQIEAVDGRR